MRIRKVILVLLGVFCAYVLAAGGIAKIAGSPDGAMSALFRPLTTLQPFDAGLLMMGAIFLVWALLLGKTGEGINRATLLNGVALGSAVLTALFLGCAVIRHPLEANAQFTGVVALMALLQGFVGLTAATLLAMRTESWKRAPVPIVINGALTALAIFLVCIPMLTPGTEG